MKKFLESMLFKSAPKDIGEIFIEWEFPEYNKHPRGRWWYILAALVVIGFLIFAVLTINFLFAVIVLFVAVVLAFQQMREPRQVTVKISEIGIWLDGQFYQFDQLESFWLIYNPPVVKKLFVNFKKSPNKILSLALEDINPLLVRQILEPILEEKLDRVREPLDEILGRKLKLF